MSNANVNKIAKFLEQGKNEEALTLYQEKLGAKGHRYMALRLAIASLAAQHKANTLLTACDNDIANDITVKYQLSQLLNESTKSVEVFAEFLHRRPELATTAMKTLLDGYANRATIISLLEQVQDLLSGPEGSEVYWSIFNHLSCSGYDKDSCRIFAMSPDRELIIERMFADNCTSQKLDSDLVAQNLDLVEVFYQAAIKSGRRLIAVVEHLTEQKSVRFADFYSEEVLSNEENERENGYRAFQMLAAAERFPEKFRIEDEIPKTLITSGLIRGLLEHDDFTVVEKILTVEALLEFIREDNSNTYACLREMIRSDSDKLHNLVVESLKQVTPQKRCYVIKELLSDVKLLMELRGLFEKVLTENEQEWGLQACEETLMRHIHDAQTDLEQWQPASLRHYCNFLKQEVANHTNPEAYPEKFAQYLASLPEEAPAQEESDSGKESWCARMNPRSPNEAFLFGAMAQQLRQGVPFGHGQITHESAQVNPVIGLKEGKLYVLMNSGKIGVVDLIKESMALASVGEA